MDSSPIAGRLNHLDSMRGIASVVVLIDHMWSVNAESFRTAHHSLKSALVSFPDFALYCFAKLEEAGRSAVLLFFVLSGFVLAYSLKKYPLPYAGYVVKRVFRIYPAFLVAILLSYLLHSLIGVPHEAESEWVRVGVNNADLSLVMLLRTLALLGTSGTHGLDGVDWSLVHEMRISLIFPLLLMMITRYRAVGVLAFLVVSAICAIAVFFTNGVVVTGFLESSFALTCLDTGFFLVFFAAGAYLALEAEKVARVVSGMPIALRVGLFGVATFAFLKADTDNHVWTAGLVDYLRGAGACVLIALALGSREFRDVLNHRLPVWLGRISYSLYLVHLPILYAVNQTASDWSALKIVLVVVPLSFISATLLANLVEFPSMNFGKWLSAGLSRRGSRNAVAQDDTSSLAEPSPVAPR